MDLSPAVDDAARIDMFQAMVLVRTFEDALIREQDAGSGPTTTELRLSAGREPVAVGVCAHLEADDALTVAHRPHHLAIARGMDLRKLAAESLSHESPGQGSGQGGRSRWHLFDPDTHFVSTASVAENYPPALGRAFGFQQRHSGQVAVAVTDSAAARQEGFREALNLAALWALPLVFVVENDDWGVEPPRAAGVAATGPGDNAGRDVPAERVEDNAVETVYEAGARAIGRARRGAGPSVIEVHTAQLQTPSGADPPADRADRASALRPNLYEVVGRDPIPTYERVLRDHGLLNDAQVRRIRDEAQAGVEEAFAFALSRSADAGVPDALKPAEWERTASR